MNNKVLDIYSDDLTDAETESLFSTPKESRKGDRRKIDYKKAKRKELKLIHLQTGEDFTLRIFFAKNFLPDKNSAY